MLVNGSYKQQVRLLLEVLPEVAKANCFALHGGTAINLFVRDMPRLSVDIDLTYIPLEDRQASLAAINSALLAVKARVENMKPGCSIAHKPQTCKLLVSEKGASIKIEVNMVGRGVIDGIQKAVLCKHAQDEFDAFCAIQMVSIGQLFGGKICAALDRQHPRDIFDVKLLLENEGLSDEIKRGFIYGLLGSDRPIHELLNPNLLDQREIFERHFSGMTTALFTYDDFEVTRADLIKQVHAVLSAEDRVFILAFNRLKPDWSRYSFNNFPSVKWKLQNIEMLKNQNAKKYEHQHNALVAVLADIYSS